MADIGDALTWVQGQSPSIKAIASCLLVAVTGLAIYIMWQKPNPGTTSASISAQTGNISSAGQSGGVTAGFYINNNPPLTDQQKQEALNSLEDEIGDLAAFPSRTNAPQPPTILEYPW